MRGTSAKAGTVGLLLAQVMVAGVRPAEAQDSALVSVLERITFSLDSASLPEHLLASDYTRETRWAAAAYKRLAFNCSGSTASVPNVPVGFGTFTAAQAMTTAQAASFVVGRTFTGGAPSRALVAPSGQSPTAEIQPDEGACKLDRKDWVAVGGGGRFVAKIVLSSGKFSAYGLEPSTGTGAREFALWVGLDNQPGNEGIFRAIVIPLFTPNAGKKSFTMFYNRNPFTGSAIIGCGSSGYSACWVDPPSSSMALMPPPNAQASQTWVWTANGCLCSGYGCH